MKLSTIFSRSIRLKCPCCGQGKLFRSWFMMYEKCSHCELKYEREPGYFLGSIYINYALTAVLATASFLTLSFTEAVDRKVLLGIVLAFSILFPMIFFRWARSLWLSFDRYFDPPKDQTDANASSSSKNS